MVSLNSTDESVMTDLAPELGTPWRITTKEADCEVGVKAQRVDSMAALGNCVAVQARILEVSAFKSSQRGRTMQSERAEGEVTKVPDHLTELAANVLKYLSDVQARNRELTNQLADVMAAHRQDAMELVAAETREMATNEELVKALHNSETLRAELAWAQRPWWTKLWQRRSV